jgi:DNA repair photolyase
MHDITVDNLEVCLATLHNLLKAGNKVLITSKPEIDCITEICKLLDIYKDKILFRFTIGTSYNDILELWEPGAPTFEERFCCLTYAFVKGYKTSISMEPMLNCKSIAGDVRMMLPFVTDSIWIGKMNKIESRVCNIPSSEVDRIRQNQADDEIRLLYNELKYYSKVKWKDSCKEVLNLKRPSKIGQDI